MDQQTLLKPVVVYAKIYSQPLSTLVKLFLRYVEKILDNIVSYQNVQIHDLYHSKFHFTVYLDLGRGTSDSATLSFTFSGTYSRYWDIKVTQIPCDVNYE